MIANADQTTANHTKEVHIRDNLLGNQNDQASINQQVLVCPARDQRVVSHVQSMLLPTSSLIAPSIDSNKLLGTSLHSFAFIQIGRSFSSSLMRATANPWEGWRL